MPTCRARRTGGRRLDKAGALARRGKLLYKSSKPICRARVFRQSPHWRARSPRLFIIDEADDSHDAFLPAARELVIAVSPSKILQGILQVDRQNATRAATWARRRKFFRHGRGLTCQAGLAVRKDRRAFGAPIGSTHAARNGQQSLCHGLRIRPAPETLGLPRRAS